MHRRDFLKKSAAAMAVSGFPRYAEQLGGAKTRVGMIGSGWYGKSDLLRLIQVAPVEVVSLCDVDKQMVADAADMVATRQASKKKPRTYTDYRAMLKERDLDIVIIETPDHWHALPMIDAVKAGMDVWVQKPISVDVVEGQAMLAAARKYKTVVQVGMQRRSTPHLDRGARQDIVKSGKLGKIAHRRDLLLLPHARDAESSGRASRPRTSTTRCGPARRRCVRTTRWCIRAAGAPSWNTATASWATCACTCSTWCAGCSTSACRRESSRAAESSSTRRARRTSPTRRLRRSNSAISRWSGPIGPGATAPDPKYPWGATIYGDKGTLKASVMSYDFIPQAKGEKPVHEDVTYEHEQFPEDKTEKDLERHVAPAIRAHMKNFLECIESRGKPVADIEQGYMSAAACILANISMQLGPHAAVGSRQRGGRGRRRSEQAAPPPVSRAVGASGSEDGIDPG